MLGKRLSVKTEDVIEEKWWNIGQHDPSSTLPHPHSPQKFSYLGPQHVVIRHCCSLLLDPKGGHIDLESVFDKHEHTSTHTKHAREMQGLGGQAHM